MKILITGGFGFLGARLAEYLLKKDYKVTLASRSKRSLNRSLLKAHSIQVDWQSESSLESISQNQDIIIHAAGMNADDCKNDPDQAHLFNAITTKKLAKLALKSGVKKFIFLSTAHVYANPLEGLLNEQSIPSNSHPYAASHLGGENFLTDVAQTDKMQGVIVRLSNNFGYPAFDNPTCWSLVINNLCLQAIKSKKMVLMGDGSEIRDFMPISLFCVAMEKILSDRLPYSLNDNIFNISSSRTLSIMEVAQRIQSYCKEKFNLNPEIITRAPDSKKLIKEFCIESKFSKLFEPSYNEAFEKELFKLLDFCQSDKSQHIYI